MITMAEGDTTATEAETWYGSRIERALLLLLGSFFTMVGLVTLLFLAASSRRLPPPPAVVNRLIPFVDLGGLSGEAYSGAMFVFLLLWGAVAFLGGLRYVIGGSSRTRRRPPSERKVSREMNHPGRAVPTLVVYGGGGVVDHHNR